MRKWIIATLIIAIPAAWAGEFREFRFAEPEKMKSLMQQSNTYALVALDDACMEIQAELNKLGSEMQAMKVLDACFARVNQAMSRTLAYKQIIGQGGVPLGDEAAELLKIEALKAVPEFAAEFDRLDSMVRKE